MYRCGLLYRRACTLTLTLGNFVFCGMREERDFFPVRSPLALFFFAFGSFRSLGVLFVGRGSTGCIEQTNGELESEFFRSPLSVR